VQLSINLLILDIQFVLHLFLDDFRHFEVGVLDGLVLVGTEFLQNGLTCFLLVLVGLSQPFDLLGKLRQNTHAFFQTTLFALSIL